MDKKQLEELISSVGEAFHLTDARDMAFHLQDMLVRAALDLEGVDGDRADVYHNLAHEAELAGLRLDEGISEGLDDVGCDEEDALELREKVECDLRRKAREAHLL